MPKKTKKAKLLAETHRRPTLTRRSPVVHSQQSEQTSPIAPSGLSYSLQAIPQKDHAKTMVLNTEYTAIKHDLVKTVFWSTLIIVGELLLSRYVK